MCCYSLLQFSLPAYLYVLTVYTLQLYLQSLAVKSLVMSECVKVSIKINHIVLKYCSLALPTSNLNKFSFQHFKLTRIIE